MIGQDQINRAILRGLKAGQYQRQIAAALGLSDTSIEGRIERHDLTPERFGLTRLVTLASELGVSREALYYRARAGDFEISPWGNIRCVTSFEAIKVRALFVHPKQADYSGWLNSAQTAGAIGITAEYLHRLATRQPAKLGGARFVRAQGMGGFILLFCPADVPALARRFNRRALPKRCSGRLCTPELADLTGVPVSRVLRWARKGAPHQKDQHGRYWFELHAVRAWLASGVIRPKDLGAVLGRMDAALPAKAA